jgi:predicted transcriptional regulator
MDDQQMDDEQKAIEKVLDEIVEEILKWQNRKKQNVDRCCSMERERGFQEGLRLSGAIVRGHYFQEEADDE